MRKLLISLLLASAAATPALADPDHNDHQNAKAERAQSRGQAHEEHSQRAATAVRPQFSGQNRVNGVVGGGAVNGSGQPHFNGAVGGQVQLQNEQADVRNAEHSRGPHIVNNNTSVNARDWRGGRRGFNGQQDQVIEQGQQVQPGGPRIVTNNSLRQSDQPLPNVMRTHNRTPIVSDVPRPGTQPPLRRDARTADVHWNTNWRNDGHHDWHDWRNRHHSWFHLGFYYDPFGWGYQPYSVGWRMWPAYYGSSFWINDPWQYRLPYAPPGTQWVRYYNDAVLVDVWTGQVLDVVYNFFW